MIGNSTAQSQKSGTLCTEAVGMKYKYYGTPETCFWSLAGIMTISLNSYYLNMQIKNSQRRTKYTAYLSFLLGSNVFTGATIHPSLAYWAQGIPECTFSSYVLMLSIFFLVMPMLLTSMITIDRLKTILRMAKHPVQSVQLNN